MNDMAEREAPSALNQSPRVIARKIEAYVARDARAEERRARKALLLLKARDRHISTLEKRVAQLEHAAADMHALTLRAEESSTPDSTGDRASYALGVPRKIPVLELSESSEPREKGIDRESHENSASRHEALVVPVLKLSGSSSTDSENDVFSTPGTLSHQPVEHHRRQTSDASTCVLSDDTVYSARREPRKPATTESLVRKGNERDATPGSSTTEVDAARKCGAEDKMAVASSRQTSRDRSSKRTTGWLQAKEMTRSAVVGQMRNGDGFDRTRNVGQGQEANGSIVRFDKLESSRSAKLSPGVPWVRVKRQLRRKSRGCDVGFGKTEAIFRANETGRGKLGFDSGSKSLPAMSNAFAATTDNKDGGVARSLDTRESASGRPMGSDRKKVLSMKRVIIQTAPVQVNDHSEFKLPNDRREANTDASELEDATHLAWDKRSSKYWSADDEPAPQWLIEEALSRGEESKTIGTVGTMHDTLTETPDNDFSRTKKYEEVIEELEKKLNDATTELKIVYEKKNNLKEKFKRALQSARQEGKKENEALQEKIVQICATVLEKFGPYALSGKKSHVNSSRNHNKAFRSYGKLAKRLQRKLKTSLLFSNKLKQELAAVNKSLAEKTTLCETLNERLACLKQHLEITEVNLNDLINENASLRKKFDDTREWMESRIGKERHERNNAAQLRDMQKSREILNLKKKADENFAMITQLRNKLIRTESANANKGILLTSYKARVAELANERDAQAEKSKKLENDLSQLRTSNSQLKAKVSLLLNEKEKLILETGKFEWDAEQKVESKIAQKYEKSWQDEIESLKMKHDESLRVTRERMNSHENCIAEFSSAITEFLKRVNERVGEAGREFSFADGELSNREAHETACAILNMTPNELSGFMKGEPALKKINVWIADFQGITKRPRFSDALADFLFEKAFGDEA